MDMSKKVVIILALITLIPVHAFGAIGGRGGMQRGGHSFGGRPGGQRGNFGGAAHHPGFQHSRPGAVGGGRLGQPGYAGLKPGFAGRPGYGLPGTGAGVGGMGPQARPGLNPGYARPGHNIPISRPGGIIKPTGNRPTTLPGNINRPGQGGGPGQRPGGQGVLRGNLNPDRMLKNDANRNPAQLNQQKDFMRRRFDAKHDYYSLYRGNFPLFISLFPTAFFSTFGYYPPIYYDYYDENGDYPEENPDYDDIASGAKPLDYGPYPEQTYPQRPGPIYMQGPQPMMPGMVPPQGYGPQNNFDADGQGGLEDMQGPEESQTELTKNILFGVDQSSQAKQAANEQANAIAQGKSLDACSANCMDTCKKNRSIAPAVCQQQCASICLQQASAA